MRSIDHFVEFGKENEVTVSQVTQVWRLVQNSGAIFGHTFTNVQGIVCMSIVMMKELEAFFTTILIFFLKFVALNIVNCLYKCID